MTSVDPRRTQPFCTPTCYRQCRCSRWPGYLNRFGWPVIPSGELEYYEKVLSYSPIAYWPLWETAGAVAEDLVNSPAQDGTYVGVTLAADTTPMGTVAPFFDGANDYVDIGNATFRGAFQVAAQAQRFSILIWSRVSGVGVWTDGAEREQIRILVNGSNFAFLRKTNANNRTEDYYAGGGVLDVAANTPYSNIEWFCSIMTFDRIANEMKGYWDGVQIGGTQVGLGLWAGIPGVTTTCIGSLDTAPTAPWSGYLAHCAIFDYALPLATVEELSTP